VTTTRKSTRFLSFDHLKDPIRWPKLVVVEGRAADSAAVLSAAEASDTHRGWSVLAA
jgi:hypothetical protein